ncbi:MAG: tetratricopeptide repeat protein [Prochloraceae cyanobacterium]
MYPPGSPVKQTPQTPQNLPRSGIRKFVGRDRDLEKLHEELQSTERGIVITAVTGMGGIGKTELALQYALAKREENDYQSGICWLQARDQDLAAQLVKYARIKLKLTLPEDFTLEQNIAFIWENWPNQGNILVVFDDVTSYESIKNFLPPNSPKFKIIITTRLQYIADEFKQLDLELLTEDASLELLKSLTNSEKIEQELDLAKQLCERLGYLPLALELVGQYLAKHKNLTLNGMKARLEDQGLKDTALQKKTKFAKTKKGVKAAFKLSWLELDPPVQDLACLLSLFALAPIGWNLVEQCLPDIDQKNLEEYRDNELIQLSFLKSNEDGTYQLHQLVREYFHVQLEEEDKKEIKDELKTKFCQGIAIEANKILQTPTIHELEKVSLSIPHIMRSATELKDWVEDKDIIPLFIGLGNFYRGQGAYKEAQPWFEQCLFEAKKRLGTEHLNIATSLSYLGSLYGSQGKYEAAEPLYQEALAMRQKLLGDEHPLVAFSLNKLAELYYSQGKYEDAELLMKEAIYIAEKTLGVNHPNTITLKNNLEFLKGERVLDQEQLIELVKIALETIDSETSQPLEEAIEDLEAAISSEDENEIESTLARLEELLVIISQSKK